jgi:opacity protein-like surface antigen
MKKALLFAAASSVLCTAANAAPFYLGAYGGVNLQANFSGESKYANWNLNPNEGYVLGLVAGVPIEAVPGLAAEADISWRHSASRGEFWGCSDFPLDGTDGTFAALVNLRYSKDIGLPVVPYALVGAGYAARRLTINPTPDNVVFDGNGFENQGLAWQVGAGLEYQVSDSTKVGLGYRYFVGPSIARVADFGYDRTFFESKDESHEVLLEVKFAM